MGSWTSLVRQLYFRIESLLAKSIIKLVKYRYSFVDNDSFIRRTKGKNHIRNGVIKPAAFSDNHETLSLTYRNELLCTIEGVDEYQRKNQLPVSGDLPGLCMLTHHNLTKELNPPRPPRHEPEQTDPKYGHLHCVIDRPEDENHRSLMAFLAEKNTDLIRELVKDKNRLDK